MAEDGYAYDRVPPGYHFCPSEQELLLYYLRPKVNAEEVPGENHVVFDFNLYSDQPRKIWDHFQTTRQNDLKMSNDLYLFTELQTKTTNGSRVSRTVGSGTWKGEDGGKKICAPGTDHVIGIKKRFRYENKGSAEHGKWLMNEFELGQSLIHNRQVSICCFFYSYSIFVFMPRIMLYFLWIYFTASFLLCYSLEKNFMHLQS